MDAFVWPADHLSSQHSSPSRPCLASLPQCLLNSTVGLTCPLAQKMMTPVAGGKVSHYVGILRTLTAGKLGL